MPKDIESEGRILPFPAMPTQKTVDPAYVDPKSTIWVTIDSTRGIRVPVTGVNNIYSAALAADEIWEQTQEGKIQAEQRAWRDAAHDLKDKQEPEDL
jgi:hypothetical protein